MNELLATWMTYLQGELMGGLFTTIILTVTVILLSIIWAVIPALARMATARGPRLAATFYIEFFRGTPILVQLFALFFGLSALGVLLSPWTSAVVILVLHAGGLLAESYRSGLQSVPTGQREAAAALGMSPLLAFRRVVAPLALRTILPAIGNSTIFILLLTPVVALIGVKDLMYEAIAIQSRRHDWSVYPLIALIYVALGLTLAWLNVRLERRLRLP